MELKGLPTDSDYTACVVSSTKQEFGESNCDRVFLSKDFDRTDSAAESTRCPIGYALQEGACQGGKSMLLINIFQLGPQISTNAASIMPDVLTDA